MRRKRIGFDTVRSVEPLEARLLLAGDLVAQWRADQLTDVADGQPVTEWIDSISGIKAMAGGEPILVEDSFGRRPAIQFSNPTEKDFFSVSRSDNPISGGSEFSVVVVFSTQSENLRPTDGAWHEGTGIVQSNQIGFAHDWGIAINQDGNAAAGVGGGFNGVTTSVFDTAKLDDGQPHVVIFSNQQGNLLLAADGSEPVTVAGNNSRVRDSLVLEFGVGEDRPGQFEGEIAEVRIYNGPFTAAEATATYNEVWSFYNNQLPTANDDNYQTTEDSILFLSEANSVLINDVDPDGDAITATLVTTTKHGELGFRSNGTFVYNPDDDFFGTDSFTYVANDFGPSEPATVTIEVAPSYDAPEPQDDRYKTKPGNVLTIPRLIGVLQNDRNTDKVPMTAVLVDPPNFGTLQLSEDGSFTFDPQESFGIATFTYQIDDGIGKTDPASVTLIVNSAPVINDDTFEISEDTLLQRSAETGVLANDVDFENNQLIARLDSEPEHGIIGFADDGSFIYEPNPHYFGTDSFTYRISDGEEETGLATATIQVLPVNDPPVVLGDAYFLTKDETLTIPSQRGVLANDVDIEGQALTVSTKEAPSNGTLTLEPDGSLTYVPNAGFSGEDRFVYEASDTDGGLSTSEVVLYVGSAPIQISEFMAANGATLETRVRAEPDDRFRGDRLSPDWIELQNVSNSQFDLTDFQLTDDSNHEDIWQFPAGTTIPAQGYLLVMLNGISISDPNLDENGYLHTDFKLDVKGDYLALLSPNGSILDQTDEQYPQQVADVSFGRTADGFRYQLEPTPGLPNAPTGLPAIADDASVSVPAGYYSEPIQVEISTETADGIIRYTLDSSEPTETNGIVYDQPIEIAATSLLRTRVFKEGLVPSFSRTHSYLYLDDVLTQPSDPAGFPPNWERAGAADYEVDPRVATDTESDYYNPNVRTALQSHDAISIVTNMEHLFDRDDGIYVNPQRDGVAWERPASMELISSDGDSLMQINAGLRIQGGASRNPNRPKHNMRFLFKETYGESVLDFPLFADSEIETINTLIMRGGNGDSWFHPSSTQQSQAQYIRDQWHKETQQLMGHTFVPQRYMHIYLNGLYWGFYHVFEKPNASFFAERFGGEPEEYDVIQHQNGIVDGTRDTWNNILSIARSDIESNATYERIKQEVAMPDFMDYMLLNFYSGNVDWDQNNWFGGRKRDGGKYRFFTWDAERTFLNPTDNRSNVLNRNQPSDLHREMRANDEYRLEFADQVHEHFFNDGLLTPDSAAERWLGLADEIELPLGAESARWGDNKRPNRPYTPENEWKRETDRLITTYIPRRTERVLDQLKRLDLYPDVAAPEFNQHGGEFSSDFKLSISAAEGTIYYTTDGSDPRIVGGEVSENALVYNGEIEFLGDTTVQARALVNGEWSALNQATFLTQSIPASSDSIRISEINYHPADPSEAEIAAGFDNDNDFEFLELTNISQSTVDLSGLEFITADDQGIEFDFSFADITRVAPGEQVLIVEDAAAFALRYGDQLPVAGEWSGRLSNGGEQITLVTGDTILQQFTYDDAWYETTDGGGFTLEAADIFSIDLDDWSRVIGWKASDQLGGSPGGATIAVVIPGDSNHDGVFNSTDLVLVFQAGEYEDNVAANSTFEEGDWNGDLEFDSTDLVFVFQKGTFVSEASSFQSSGDTSRAIDAFYLDVEDRQRREDESDAHDAVSLVPRDELQPASAAELQLMQLDFVFERYHDDVELEEIT